MAAKVCPNCGLLAPGAATVCQCGYDFEAGGMRVPRPRGPRPIPEAELGALADGPTAAPEAQPSLLVRVFAMPFLPPLWARATGWRAMQVIGPLLLLALLLDGGLAVYRGWGMRDGIGAIARQYERSYPAILVKDGKVSVEGDRVIQFSDGRQTTFLVDPKETIPLERITTREYIVVRETQIIRRQTFRTEVTKVSDLQKALGNPIRIDSAAIRAFDARWGLVLQIGMWALMLLFSVAADLFGVVYVAAAAGLAMAFRGHVAGRTYGQCFLAALAVYSLVLVIGVALNLVGKSPGFCMGLWLWPLILTGATTWVVGGERA
jgi:Protein of unknown function (DUF1189)